ncbi:MAG TPA: hypothetical protein PLN54_14190, partial [Flavobacteriales bacterium]|nr:hypothetical protein [Flavobacteriales bacterium]
MKEFWDERYGAEEYAYGTAPNAWFAEQLKGLMPGSLLLPAEGEGRNAVPAARLGWKVTAFDLSERSLKFGRDAQRRGFDRWRNRIWMIAQRGELMDDPVVF